MKLTKKTWGIIIRSAIAVVIVAVITVLIVLLARDSDGTKTS